MSKRNKLFLFLFVLLSFAVIPFLFEHKRSLLNNIYVQDMMHVYHSFRKIPDILFIPEYIFTKSNLDKYEIYISDKQLLKLNSKLKNNPFDSTLDEHNKVWASATFMAKNYVDNVKIKYRGDLANHWNSYKKSYTVKFPKYHLFNGMRELVLIVPYDREYFATSLNNFRVRKMGGIVPDEYYVRFSVNGSEDGVMLAMEHWSQEWLEKQKISSQSILFGVSEIPDGVSMYSKEGLEYWKSWNSDEDTFPQLEMLINLVEKATDDEFEKIAPTVIDLKSFYIEDIVRILSGGYHTSDNGNNVVLLFDAGEGRFKTIPYNVGLSDINRGFNTSFAPKLQKRIWNIKRFAEERDKLLDSYLKQNKDDDVKFINAWIKKMKIEFYRDNAKLHNNFMFRKKISKYANDVKEYLKNPPKIESELKDDFVGVKKADFPPIFSNVLDASASVYEFLKFNKQFYEKDGIIILPAGRHVFLKNLIIPRDTKLIIKPGAILLMGKNVSLISYSPVYLSGLENNNIIFSSFKNNDKWGSFAVVNTENASSTVSNVEFNGGAGANLNGVVFSGTVSFYNSDVSITSSKVVDIFSEDGINVKNSSLYIVDNVIKNTVSDGIDFDFVLPNSVLKNNIFTDIGGDAIDVSGSDFNVTGNVIVNCFDKGISVGEKSNLFISKNIIKDCKFGFAVKDKSKVLSENNTLINNNTAIAAYKKKDVFGGGTATSSHDCLWKNKKDLFTDNLSSVTFLNVDRTNSKNDIPEEVKQLIAL